MAVRRQFNSMGQPAAYGQIAPNRDPSEDLEQRALTNALRNPPTTTRGGQPIQTAAPRAPVQAAQPAQPVQAAQAAPPLTPVANPNTPSGRTSYQPGRGPNVANTAASLGGALGGQAAARYIPAMLGKAASTGAQNIQGMGLGIGAEILGQKLKPKEEMPTFGGAHGDLTDRYGRRLEGAGPGVLGGAVRGAGYLSNPALAAATFGIAPAAGAVGGALAGAFTKNATSAYSDFSANDAQRAVSDAYSKYLGRDASPGEVMSQLKGQGWQPEKGDRWVGEKGLTSVLDSIQGSEEAKKYQATQNALASEAPAAPPTTLVEKPGPAPTPGQTIYGGAGAPPAPPRAPATAPYASGSAAPPPLVAAQSGAASPPEDPTQIAQPSPPHPVTPYDPGAPIPPPTDPTPEERAELERMFPGGMPGSGGIPGPPQENGPQAAAVARALTAPPEPELPPMGPGGTPPPGAGPPPAPGPGLPPEETAPAPPGELPPEAGALPPEAAGGATNTRLGGTAGGQFLGKAEGFDINKLNAPGVGDHDTSKYQFLSIAQHYDPGDPQGLEKIVSEAKAAGLNWTFDGKDKVDFGDGYGPIDVLTQATPGQGGKTWWWGAGAGGGEGGVTGHAGPPSADMQGAYANLQGMVSAGAGREEMEAAIRSAYGGVPGFEEAYKESVKINGKWYDLVGGYGGNNPTWQMMPKDDEGAGFGGGLQAAATSKALTGPDGSVLDLGDPNSYATKLYQQIMQHIATNKALAPAPQGAR